MMWVTQSKNRTWKCSGTIAIRCPSVCNMACFTYSFLYFIEFIQTNSSRNNSPTVFVIVRNILCDVILRNTSGITMAHARFTVHGAFCTSSVIHHHPTLELTKIELKIPVSTIWLSSMLETGPKARIACFRTFQEGSFANKRSSETPNWIRTSEPRIEAASWKRLQATTR